MSLDPSRIATEYSLREAGEAHKSFCDPAWQGRFGWIDPDGKAIPIDESHTRWADRYIKQHNIILPPRGPKGWVDYGYDYLLENGWVRVIDFRNFESARGVTLSPATMKTLVSMVVGCLHDLPPKEFEYYFGEYIGERIRMFPQWELKPIDFLEKFTDRKTVDSVFEGRVASQPDVSFVGPVDKGWMKGVWFTVEVPHPDYGTDPHISKTKTLAYLIVKDNQNQPSEVQNPYPNTVQADVVWVDPDYRQKGYARKLHDMAFNWAKSRGMQLDSGWIRSPHIDHYWRGLEQAGKANGFDDTHNVGGRRWVRTHLASRVALQWLQAKKQLGDCYEAAAQYITYHGIFPGHEKGLLLVHGEVMGQGPLEGTTYGHAWVLDGDTVIDVSNGQNLRMPKSEYYALGRINEIGNVRTYTAEEARDHLLKWKVYGPWELKTRSGL